MPEPIKDIKPGTCVALYMAVGAAPLIAAHLRSNHPDVAFDVDVVAKAQRSNQTVLTCEIEDLPERLKSQGIEGEALLMIRWRREQNDAIPLQEKSLTWKEPSTGHQPKLMAS